MLKKIVLIILLICSPVFASEIAVKITPASIITTSNDRLQEGDYIEFKIIKDVNAQLKKGSTLTGIITFLEPNGFFGKEALVTIDRFKTSDGQKLNGIIYAKGNQHNQIMEFHDDPLLSILFPTAWVRGGEVNLKPEKDTFLLFLEN